ncbi:MAG: peptidoglycan-binding protein [Candidatus Pacebacteria bacterium]|nr:peptidoglycan-binding protein [Candidatus Paceibacterota bacterium]
MDFLHSHLSRKFPLYRLWHEHPLSEVTHWVTFILIAITFTTSLLANIQSTYALNSPSFTIGPVSCGYMFTSLTYNGGDFKDPGQNTCINIREIQNTSGGSMSLGSDQGTVFDSQTNTLTFNYSQGNASLQFVQNGPSIDIHVSVTNNTATDIGYLSFHMGGLNITGYTGDSLPTSQAGDYPNIWGFNTTFGELFLVNTNKVTGDCGSPTPWCLLSTSIGSVPHGTTVTATNAIKFYPLGTSLLEAVPEVISAWTAQYPMQNFWSDRRPIGTDFLSSPPCPIVNGCASDFSKNMNGWFSNGIDPGSVDVTTPEGRQAWATQMLARIDADIANVKEVNGQGVILWDLEGQRWPHCTSYIGDPRYAEDPRFAPEWDTQVNYVYSSTTNPSANYSSTSMNVIDAAFHKILDNGLRAGITIRPDQIVYDPGDANLGCGGGGLYGIYGVRPSQQYVTDTAARIQLLKDKINYAKSRWGVTIFYIDSTDWIAGTDMIQVHQDIPDVLLMPENTTLLEYTVGIPFKYTRLQGFYGGPGTIGNIGDIYPEAAVAVNSNNEVTPELVDHYWELVNAVRHGSVTLFNSWFNTAEKQYIKMIYASSSVPVVAPTISTPTATGITASDVTFNASVLYTGGSFINQRGFKYGTDTAYASSTDFSGTLDASLNNTDAAVTATINDLSCGTTYHYMFYARNFDGATGSYVQRTASSSDQTFNTTDCVSVVPPTVSVSTIGTITQTGADLNANVDTTGGSSVTELGFRYGATVDYSATSSTSGHFNTGAFSKTLTGLTCGTTYHYQAYAINFSGTGVTSDGTFTTSACSTSGGNPVVYSGGGGGGGGTYYSLTIQTTGTGHGTTTSNPSGILCSSKCTSAFYAGSKITLTAIPDKYSHLTSWSGCASFATSTCTVTLSSSMSVFAKFDAGSANTVIQNISAPVTTTIVPPTTGSIPTAYLNLEFGSRSTAVLTLQKYLIAGGYLSSVYATGYYGQLTANAVAQYRASRSNVSATGSVTTTSSGSALTSYLFLGTTGQQVKTLQKILNAKGYTIATSGNGSVGNESTYFGPSTQVALQKFQCAVLSVCSGSPLTTGYGATGPRTRAALGGTTAPVTQTNTVTPASVPTPTKTPTTATVPVKTTTVKPVVVPSINFNF